MQRRLQQDDAASFVTLSTAARELFADDEGEGVWRAVWLQGGSHVVQGW